MKILPISSNSKKMNKSQYNTNQPLYLNNNSNAVSFGNKTSIIKSLWQRLFKTQQIEIPKVTLPRLNKEIFLSRLESLTTKDEFQILTKDGKIVHHQNAGDHSITDDINKKANGNIAIWSTENGIDVSNLATFWNNGATHIFSVNRNAKQIDVIELAQPTPRTIKIKNSINKDYLKEARKMYAAIDPFDPPSEPVINKLKSFEQKYVNRLIAKLGFTKTSYYYHKTPDSFSYSVIKP